MLCGWNLCEGLRTFYCLRSSFNCFIINSKRDFELICQTNLFFLHHFDVVDYDDRYFTNNIGR